ncbi:MAG: sphinganine-1-phosphate aldolase [Hyphomicrobiaceae bacterium]|jgi:sphinganine-1-phosphate aldolase
MTALPPKGTPAAEILAELEERAAGDVDWKTGRVLTGLYDPGETAHNLAVSAYTRYLAQNALYINMYPSVGELEREVVGAIRELLRGDDATCGNVTSGGTESILVAMKASRDHAREHRPEIFDPEILVPVTAHPAFLKAAHYLGMRVRVAPVDSVGFRTDLKAFEAALGPNTIVAVGSAPNFSHGTVDPIADMAAMAAARNILFHVDGCVGGIYLSVLRRMGRPVRDFDFSVPGVTSISVDLHKYGYAPKNASVVAYRDRELRKHAWFVCSSTTEYAVINPTAQSTRTAGPVAAAWAVMRHFGEEGFAEIVAATEGATAKMLRAIEDIAGIEVLGDPEMAMFTLASDASDEINIFELDDRMRARGWSLLPQFACGGSPANLHVSIGRQNVAMVDTFVDDLRECVGELLTNGPSLDSDEMARVVEAVLDKPLDDILIAIAPLAGLTGAALPENMGPLNTMLNLLPADRRDELLRAYVNMTS